MLDVKLVVQKSRKQGTVLLHAVGLHWILQLTNNRIFCNYSIRKVGLFIPGVRRCSY